MTTSCENSFVLSLMTYEPSVFANVSSICVLLNRVRVLGLEPAIDVFYVVYSSFFLPPI